MSQSRTLIAFARDLHRVPPGFAAPRGLSGAEVSLLAHRLDRMAEPLVGLVPAAAERLRLTAAALTGAPARKGVTAAELTELCVFLAMLSGYVALHEPAADAADDGRAA
ncbi:hypothetical protein [Azospirillum halopraeferens]|uniref:hypothetical protein n=1 Tax=Azospirillum halopraeferens TaxID=34010 RepID=UPI0004177136|nr:hypothetical protein [Azospirillum halopraeferens]